MLGGQNFQRHKSAVVTALSLGTAKASIGCAIISGLALVCAISSVVSWTQSKLGTWTEPVVNYSFANIVFSLALVAATLTLTLWLARRADKVLTTTRIVGELDCALTLHEDVSISSVKEAIAAIIPSVNHGNEIIRSFALVVYGATLVLGGVAFLGAKLYGPWPAPLVLLSGAIFAIQASLFFFRLHKPDLSPPSFLSSSARFFRLWRLRPWPKMMFEEISLDKSSERQSSSEELFAWLPAIAIILVGVLQISLGQPVQSHEDFNDGVITILASLLIGPGIFVFGKALVRLPESVGVLEAESLARTQSRSTDVRALTELNGDVMLSDAVLFHPSRKKPVFEKVNLLVEAGTVVGLTGEPGSGKTVLLKTILGQTKLESGSVVFGTCNGEIMDYRERQTWVAGLLQGDRPTALTLMNNIRLFGSHDTKSAFASAALVGLGIEPRALPQGLSTMAGDRGAHLSTSEQQRLGLACVLSSGAQIVLVDDVTATIGQKRMTAVFDYIRKEGKTMILVSRDSTILSCTDVSYGLVNGHLTKMEF